MKLCDCHGNYAYVLYEIENCPLCTVHKLMDQDEQKIRELKEEVHRQAEELGRPTLIAIINREMLEVCQKMIATIANAEREAKREEGNEAAGKQKNIIPESSVI